MRQIENLLIVRVRVHSCHDSGGDAEVFMQHLRNRREAVRRARRVGDDAMFGDVEDAFVDAHANGDVGILRRCGDDDVLDGVAQMARRFLLRREAARRFDDDLRAMIAPGNVGRIGTGENAQLFAVDGNAVRRVSDRIRDRAMHRVVFEEIRERRCVGQIVDGDKLDVVRMPLQRRASDVAPDSPKSVNPNFHHRYDLRHEA